MNDPSDPEAVVQSKKNPHNFTDEVIARIEARLEVMHDGCIEWKGARNKDGYGNVRVGKKFYRVHRLIWEYYNGLVPEGLELDHLCKNRPCANLEHLEPVPHKVNQQRITKCPNGHYFDSTFGTYRLCTTCGAVTPGKGVKR